MRVLVVDDDEAIRKMLRRLLERKTSFEVVGEASSGAEGLALAAALKPDVVIMDVEMRRMDGIAATRQMKEMYPEIQVLAFSSAQDDETRAAMLEAGAVGFLVKGQPQEEIIYALHAARDAPIHGPGRGSLGHFDGEGNESR